MKKNIVLGFTVVLTIFFSLTHSAWAGDAANGAKVFSANCAACHMGGGNVVNGAKTLKREDLEKYDMNDIEKMQYQVTNGKNAMPSFKGRLTAQEIEDVAAYVLAQAEKGW